MSQYASKTQVSPEKSLSEIQKILTKYGAARFGYVQDETRVGIEFMIFERRVRFVMPLPLPKEFERDKRRVLRSATNLESVLQQATRQRYRALVLAIKSKLESVESGIETFEEAFMAHIVLPSGQTMGQWAKPQIESSYKSGNMPPLLGNFH